MYLVVLAELRSVTDRQTDRKRESFDSVQTDALHRRAAKITFIFQLFSS